MKNFSIQTKRYYEYSFEIAQKTIKFTFDKIKSKQEIIKYLKDEIYEALILYNTEKKIHDTIIFFSQEKEIFKLHYDVSLAQIEPNIFEKITFGNFKNILFNKEEAIEILNLLIKEQEDTKEEMEIYKKAKQIDAEKRKYDFFFDGIITALLEGKSDEEIMTLLKSIGNQELKEDIMHLLSQNIDLIQRLYKDDLTGVLSNQFYNVFLNPAFKNMRKRDIRQIEEFRLFLKNKKVNSIAYIDLANFKSINDLISHDFGDKVIKHFVSLLEKEMKKLHLDTVIRRGGDEFIVIGNEHKIQELEKILRSEAFIEAMNNFIELKEKNIITLPGVGTAQISIAQYTNIVSEAGKIKKLDDIATLKKTFSRFIGISENKCYENKEIDKKKYGITSYRKIDIPQSEIQQQNNKLSL